MTSHRFDRESQETWCFLLLGECIFIVLKQQILTFFKTLMFIFSAQSHDDDL